MTTLTDFLLSRIAEDEDALECIETVTYRDRWFQYPNGETKRVSPHGLILHGRRRLLAECEAKRRIVEEHSPREFFHPGGSQVMCSLDSDDVPCRTVRLLALPYADHPDYREEWRA